MAKRRRTMKMPPRMSGSASKCISYASDGSITEFVPKPKHAKYTTVEKDADGKLYIKITDL